MSDQDDDFWDGDDWYDEEFYREEEAMWRDVSASPDSAISSAGPTPRLFPNKVIELNRVLTPPVGVVAVNNHKQNEIIDKCLTDETKQFDYILTPAVLCSELLSFLCTPLSQDPQRLLQVGVSSEVVVNPLYCFPANDPRKTTTRNYVSVVSTRFRAIRPLLDELAGFVERYGDKYGAGDRGNTTPALIKEVCVYIDGMLCHFNGWAMDLSVQSREEKWDSFHIYHNTHELCDTIEYVHALFGPFLLTEKAWSVSKVADLCSRLCMQWNTLPSCPHQLSTIGRMQSRFVASLLSSLDSMATEGRVPHWDQHLPFYNDPDPLRPPVVRDERSYILWPDDLLDLVLRMTTSRRELGRVDVPCVFSGAFYECLDDSQTTADPDDEAVECITRIAALPTGTLTLCLAGAARVLAETYEAELIHKIRAAGLDDVVREIKEVYCGDVLSNYASMLFDVGREKSERRYNPAQQWRHALQQSGICSTALHRWGVSGEGTAIEIVARIGHPLNIIFTERLTQHLSNISQLLLPLYRSNRVMSAMMRNKVNPVPVVCIRKFRNVLSLLFKMLHVSLAVFQEHVASIMIEWLAAIREANSSRAAKLAALQLDTQLVDIIKKEGSRKMVHDMLRMMCKIGDDMNLELVSGRVSEEGVLQWTKEVGRIRQFILDVGSQLSNNVFRILAMRIK